MNTYRQGQRWSFSFPLYNNILLCPLDETPKKHSNEYQSKLDPRENLDKCLDALPQERTWRNSWKISEDLNIDEETVD